MNTQKVDNALGRIAHRAGQPDWKPLINRTNRLKELEDEINDEMHNDPADTSRLDQEGKRLVEDLELLRDRIQTDRARHPNVTGDEFEAVGDIYDEAYDTFGNMD